MDRYGGKGVTKAVRNVEREIATRIKGISVFEQQRIDEQMVVIDGTTQRKNLGANAMVAVSMACARAAAKARGLWLFEYLRELYWPQMQGWLMPVPMMNLINGGKHAVGSVDLQEFMVMPVGAGSFSEGLQWTVEVYHKLKQIIHDRGLPVGVGDEGGFMPRMGSHEEVLELLIEAVKTANYDMGRDFVVALDPAATEVYENGAYHLKTEGKVLSSEELIGVYAGWIDKYWVQSIEDGLAEDDWVGFTRMNREMGDRIQVMGDDLFVTNLHRLQRGVDEGAANSVLVKPNQIGTVTETAEVISKAHQAKMSVVISHRSGETCDSFIADLAVACNAGQIKTGAPARSDRVAKLNQLLRIEKKLGDRAGYVRPWFAK